MNYTHHRFDSTEEYFYLEVLETAGSVARAEQPLQEGVVELLAELDAPGKTDAKARSGVAVYSPTPRASFSLKSNVWYPQSVTAPTASLIYVRTARLALRTVTLSDLITFSTPLAHPDHP